MSTGAALSLTAHLSANLPALQIVVPLLSAPICLFLRRPRLVWGWGLASSLLALAMAVTLLLRVAEGGAISYAIGNWAPPWGIEYRIDALSALLLVLIPGIAFITLLWGRASIEAEIETERQYLFYTLYILCMTGLMGMLITGDAFNLFVFLEISALSSYAMISLGKGRRALVAAYNYLVMGTIGATFYVIGIGLVYLLTGTLNMADIAQELAKAPTSRTLVAAVAFLIVGLALKLALFPLHKWLPGAYAGAPSAVTAFLASTATKVALYVLIRTFYTVLESAPLLADRLWAETLVPFALAGMISASVVAVFQKDVKRLLAYSSVAQIGYMALGVGLANVTGLGAGILHLVNHALIKSTLFMGLGAVALRLGSVRIEAMRGLGRRMPWTMAAMVIGGLSLIGVPGTAGFVSKWYLVLGAFERGWWPVAVLIMASSLLAVVYVWRIVEAAYLRPPLPDVPAPTGEAPLSMTLPLWLMAAANIWFGLDTTWTWGLARAAAQSLLGATP